MQLDPQSCLGRVPEHKRRAVVLRKASLPLEEVCAAGGDVPPPRDLAVALRALRGEEAA